MRDRGPNAKQRHGQDEGDGQHRSHVLGHIDHHTTEQPHPALWLSAGRHSVDHFLFASGFATSRAPSTKSCAEGLSVRCFSVTIPLGTRAIGSSTGKTLSSGRLMENLNAEVAKIVRKCPVASRLIRTSGGMVTTVVRG